MRMMVVENVGVAARRGDGGQSNRYDGGSDDVDMISSPARRVGVEEQKRGIA